MSDSEITIRPIRPDDAPQCGRIICEAFTTLQQHHRFPTDFPNADFAVKAVTAMAASPKYFGVVAELDGRIIGSNFLDQRDAIAGIGPITVDPAVQQRRAGRKLMQAVIERAQRDGAPSIRLVQEAFNTTSLSLYTSLGFDVKEPLALMAGKPTGDALRDGEVRAMRESDIDACAALCRHVHGFDRAGELRDVIARKTAVVLDRSGAGVVAYASCPGMWIINHGVAREMRDMVDLLLGASRLTEKGQVALLLPMRNAEFFRWSLRAGLRVQKPLTLMSMGQYHDPRGPFFPSVTY